MKLIDIPFSGRCKIIFINFHRGRYSRNILRNEITFLVESWSLRCKLRKRVKTYSSDRC